MVNFLEAWEETQSPLLLHRKTFGLNHKWERSAGRSPSISLKCSHSRKSPSELVFEFVLGFFFQIFLESRRLVSVRTRRLGLTPSLILLLSSCLLISAQVFRTFFIFAESAGGIMTSPVPLMDARLVADLRKSVQHCAERGLSVASKWCFLFSSQPQFGLLNSRIFLGLLNCIMLSLPTNVIR